MNFPADLAAWDPARLAEQIDAASRAAVTPANCDPRRYGRHGVLRCPRGCVTECAAERVKA